MAKDIHVVAGDIDADDVSYIAICQLEASSVVIDLVKNVIFTWAYIVIKSRNFLSCSLG